MVNTTLSHFGRTLLALSTAAGVFAAAWPGTALAARGSYNCKSDRVMDAPAQIQSVVAQGPARIHMTAASSGSDKSGSTRIEFYSITDDAGATYTAPGAGTIYNDDLSKLLSVVAEGLKPGAHYRVTVTSSDHCGNRGVSSTKEITMPTAAHESNPPSMTTPAIATYWAGITYVPAIVVRAIDDTDLIRLQYYIGQTLVQELDLSPMNWWASADAPPIYKWFVPTAYRGMGLQQVRVVAHDVYGNTVTTSATLPL